MPVKKTNKSNLDKAFLKQNDFARLRTTLANERNSLAYIRTGFSAFVLGLAFIKLFEHDEIFVTSGLLFLFLGILFIVLGVVFYFFRNKRINSL